MTHPRRYSIIFQTLSWLVIASQLFSIPLYADQSLATPKISQPIINLDRSIFNLYLYEIYSAFGLLRTGRSPDYVNSVLLATHNNKLRKYAGHNEEAVRHRLALGPVEFTGGYAEVEEGDVIGVFRFKNEPGKLYQAIFRPSTREYRIEGLRDYSPLLDRKGQSADEPLIGHGFTIDDVNNVKLTDWRESEAFGLTLTKLEDVLKANAPNNRQAQLILDTLRDFKAGKDGRSLGIAASRYKDSSRYYLGFGTQKSFSLPPEFLDENNPLSEFAVQALFHELFHAACDIHRSSFYIESDTTVHIAALRLAAQLFWGISKDEAERLPPNLLEHHPRNKLGDEIRAWKEEKEGMRQAMFKRDPFYLRERLSEAIKEAKGDLTASRLLDIISVCDDAALINKRDKNESYYPILHAVNLLSKREKSKLVNILKDMRYGYLRDTVLVDSVLLMLNKEVLPDWIKRQAPNLYGRTIYQFSSEIVHAGGGLGRVMQFHGFGINELIEQGAQLSQVEPYYKYDKKGGIVNYAAILGVDETAIEKIGECLIPMDLGNKARAVFYSAVDKDGIKRFFIKGFKENQKETEVPYYTPSLYLYRDADNPDVVKREEFSIFFSLASLELVSLVETPKMEKDPSAWKAPVLHFNDGQMGLAPYFKKRRYKDSQVLKGALVAFSTHTYFNRMAYEQTDNEEIDRRNSALRPFGISYEDEMLYFHHRADLGIEPHRKYRPVLDFSSAGIRCADWVNGVSAKHVDDLLFKFKYDNWNGWDKLEMVAVTNGDARMLTAKRFIESAKEIYGPDVDIEELSPEQVLKIKMRSKERFGDILKEKLDAAGKNLDIEIKDKSDLTLDPNLLVISYSGRGMMEKAGRMRALTDGNITELVKLGAQVVIGLNAQRAVEVTDGLMRLFKDLARLKAGNPKDYPGKFILLLDTDIEDQRVILAASDIQVQDSDPSTEAAGYSEANVAACAGLELAPPWKEGILQAHGIKMNLNKQGEGNVLIPDIEVSESDLEGMRIGNYGRAPNGTVSKAYLTLLKEVLTKHGSPADTLKWLSYYGANSIRLSRVLETRLTSATYLREWSKAIAFKENRFPNPIEVGPEKRAVMLISGGEAPGVNSYFAQMARKLARDGYSVEAVRFGLDGLVKAKVEFDGERVWVDWEKAEKILNMPGAFEGTARVKLDDPEHPEYLKLVMSNLKGYCETLVVIGGNDHIGEAKKIADKFKSEGVKMVVVGLKKTIDRDTKNYPAGADTAGQNANRSVLRAAPLPGSGKCVVVQMMGRDMGWLAVRAGDMRPKSLEGYTDDEIRKMNLVWPTVAMAVPEKSVDEEGGAVVSLGDLVSNVSVRMKKYNAATIVASEGFRVAKDDPVLLEALQHDKLLDAKYSGVRKDAQRNPMLTELEIGDIVTEAISLGLGLERDVNLFFENPGYSGRSTEPNNLDRAVVEAATDEASKVISDPLERAKAIEAGGVCVAVPRELARSEEVQATVIPLREAVGKIDLTDGGLYSEAELRDKNVLGYTAPGDNLADLTEIGIAQPSGYDRDAAILAIDSQSESARDMRRPNICVIARPDADELIADLKNRKPISEADEYVMDRTAQATLYIPAIETVSLLGLVKKAYEIYGQYHMLNMVLSGNLHLKSNDPLLLKLIEEARTKEMCKAIVSGAKNAGDNEIVLGRRLADLLFIAIQSQAAVNSLRDLGIQVEKPLSGVRKNILGEVLNLLPEEKISEEELVSVRNPYKEVSELVASVGHAMNLPEADIAGLQHIEKERLDLHIPVRMPDGQVHNFPLYVCLHNTALGPAKGGISVGAEDLVYPDEIRAKSVWMTMKTAIAGFPNREYLFTKGIKPFGLGGGKSGIVLPPDMAIDDKITDYVVKQLAYGYAKVLYKENLIGPVIYIPAPDIGLDARWSGKFMNWVADEYAKLSGKRISWVVTGKSMTEDAQDGIRGRAGATEEGGLYILQELMPYIGELSEKYSALKDFSPALKGKIAAVQGAGKVGTIAQLLNREGSKIVGWSDKEGALYDGNGLDIDKLAEYRRYGLFSRDAEGFPNVESLANGSMLELDVDILVLAATDGVITKDNADKIKAKVILCLANGPITPEAEKILTERGILILPDVLANIGGVTVSFFEMLQNMEDRSWTFEETKNKLRQVMRDSLKDVFDVARKNNVSLTIAAYMLAERRIVEAEKERAKIAEIESTDDAINDIAKNTGIASEQLGVMAAQPEENRFNLAKVVIVAKRGLTKNISAAKDDALGYKLSDGYQIMEQNVKKLLANDRNIVEVDTTDQLFETVGGLLKDKELKVIVLDDGSLTKDIDDIIIIKNINRGEPGKDYCVIVSNAREVQSKVEAARKAGLEVEPIPFVNLNAMAMMGVAILSNDPSDRILFEAAYKAFTGEKEVPPELMTDQNKINWLVRALPRIVPIDIANWDHQLAKLFAVSA